MEELSLLAGSKRKSLGSEATEVVRPKKKKKQLARVAVELQAGSYRPKLADVGNLLLRVFSNDYGENPKWAFVRGMNLVRAAVVLLVPCLDAQTARSHRQVAPTLSRLLGSGTSVAMRSAGEIEFFPADQDAPLAACRMVRTLLCARARPTVTSKKAAGPPTGGANSLPPIRSYVASAEDRARSGYPLLDALGAGWICTKARSASVAVGFVGGASDGHLDVGSTEVANSADCERSLCQDAAVGGGASAATALCTGTACGGALDADSDRKLLVALDCEMVMTASGPRLARISMVDVDGQLLYDTFVRPAEHITDYLTKFSGITAEILEGVETSLTDVQSRLLDLLSKDSILVGHSLENDFKALQLVHERVIDTVLLYPHPQGWPHRRGLKALAADFLKRQIKRDSGHNSIDDARVAMELARMKFEKGPGFGVGGGESAPLGRLLQAAGTRLSLIDSGHSMVNCKLGWHLEGCEVRALADDDEVVAAELAMDRSSAEEDIRTQDSEMHGGAPSLPALPREVRLVVLRDFETFCKSAVAADTFRRKLGVLGCLARLDKHVASVASKLMHNEVLVLLSGCGDLHRQQSAGMDTGQQVGDQERRQIHGSFKDAFGVFVVGGVELRQMLKLPAGDKTDGDNALVARDSEGAGGAGPPRELVTYDF